MLDRVCPNPMYLCWLQLSEAHPKTTGMFDAVAKLISFCSLLKSDDVRWCSRGDLAQEENIKPILMQCPAYSRISKEMYFWP